jgi:homoserine O-acetyltransferase/O-succinyltransferase
VGHGMALDPEKWFIIIPNMLGNGLSSSPSNMPEPYNGPRFPRVTAYDNVRLQHRLVTEKFGIERLPLVVGWSMGALQTFHWGALYPDMVERIAPFCGSAKCSRHNFVFLEGVKAALTADAAFAGGWYKTKPETGLRAMARVYAGWGFSQAFYRQQLDVSKMGHSSLEDFLVAFWEGLFLAKDANNLLAMLWTWQNGDISTNPLYGGDFVKALGAIKAKAYVMPGRTDLYFPPEDSEFEVAHMPNAKLIPIESIWGHFAGGPGTSPEDVAFLDAELKELLAS